MSRRSEIVPAWSSRTSGGAMVWVLALVAAGGGIFCAPPGEDDGRVGEQARALIMPPVVDLRPDQTPIRPSQGARNTCQVFAATAALEAAYKRAGYGDLDLSEQFMNHMGKTFWLHPFWDEIVARGEDASEAQLGAWGGGGGLGYLALMASGLKIPEEVVMPYHPGEYTGTDWPPLGAHPFGDPYWEKQRNLDDFNLNETFLPRAALQAPRYYTVSRYQKIDATSVAQIESALASGHEVVWDTLLTGTSGTIWRPCTPGSAGCPEPGAHVMLIVGYDRRDPDPRYHHFIVKNSWGPTTIPGADGFTYISYDYIAHGVVAGYIVAVPPPATWPDLAFVGRWNLDFDGFKGTLDIHHLPGLARSEFADFGVSVADRRLGVFYDVFGKPFRVNGSVSGLDIEFFIDGANPNARWDQIGGRQFDYTMVGAGPERMMAGVHRDPDGHLFGGYARKTAFLPGGTPISRPVIQASYLGASWALTSGVMSGTVHFDFIDNSFLSPAEVGLFTGLRGRLSRATGDVLLRALVNNRDTYDVRMRVPAVLGDPALGGEAAARLLNWEPGISGGTAFTASGFKNGLVMIRQ